MSNKHAKFFPIFKYLLSFPQRNDSLQTSATLTQRHGFSISLKELFTEHITLSIASLHLRKASDWFVPQTFPRSLASFRPDSSVNISNLLVNCRCFETLKWATLLLEKQKQQEAKDVEIKHTFLLQKLGVSSWLEVIEMIYSVWF